MSTIDLRLSKYAITPLDMITGMKKITRAGVLPLKFWFRTVAMKNAKIRMTRMLGKSPKVATITVETNFPSLA